MLRAHLALLTVALIYGANYSIAKIVLDDGYLEPAAFIVLRVAAGLVLFNLFHHFFIGERLERKDLGMMVLCALFGVTINQLAFFQGLTWSTPIKASLFITLTPILVLIASAILLRKRVRWLQIFGILLGVAGAVWLLTGGATVSLKMSELAGDSLLLLNAASFGLYLVLLSRLASRYHPITVTRWAFTFGFFMVLPFGWSGLQIAEWATFTPTVWWAIAYVLICTTFLTFLLNALAIKELSATTVSSYIYLQPIIATVVAIWLGKDVLSVDKIIAAVLIFAGVFLVADRGDR